MTLRFSLGLVGIVSDGAAIVEGWLQDVLDFLSSPLGINSGNFQSQP